MLPNQKNVRVAIAFYIPDINYTENKRISDNIQIDMAEEAAVKASIRWIIENRGRNEEIIKEKKEL